MKGYLCWLAWLLAFPSLFAQNRAIDSLNERLRAATAEERIELYNELALSYRGISFDRVKSYSLASFRLAERLGRPQKMASALSNLAIATLITGNVDSAGLLFNRILVLADSIADPVLHDKAVLNLGNFYYNTNRYDLALSHFRAVYPNYERRGDTLSMAGISQNTGNIHYHFEAYREALDAFQLAAILYRTGGYDTEADLLFNNIGLTWLKLNDPDSARRYLNLGLALARRQHDLPNELLVLNNLGLLALQERQYRRASDCFRESVRIAREIAYQAQEANSLINLARSCILSDRPDTGMICLTSAAPLVPGSGDQLLRRDLEEGYYLCYLKLKHYEQALDHFTRYAAIRDSVFSLGNRNRIASLTIQFETARKKIENLRLKSELALRQVREKRLVLLLFSVSLLLISILAAALLLVKYLRQKQITAGKEAELLTERLDHSHQQLASQALHLASQNEFRQKMLETTTAVYGQLDPAGREQLAHLVKDLENSVDQQAWTEFETRFEQVHAAFFENLYRMHPDLTPNDRRICAFLKLNMSTKEIAMLTHRSPRSIESSRYRLKKKFGLTAEEDILSVLQSV